MDTKDDEYISNELVECRFLAGFMYGFIITHGLKDQFIATCKDSPFPFGEIGLLGSFVRWERNQT